jgi:hypothetical protein
MVARCFVLVSGFLSACTPVLTPPTLDGVDSQQASCQVAKDPLNPLVVEWPGTSKVELDATSSRGVVIVSYAGCTLKVLSNCSIPGVYELQRVTPARERLDISTVNDLYARLPLGAASLKAQLGTETSLRLDYVAVGQRVLTKPPERLAEACDGATHYVRAITVGAYSLDSLAKGAAGLEGGGLVGPALGASRAEGVQQIRGQGKLETCLESAEGHDCSAPIQISLAPLPPVARSSSGAAGFGLGLDALPAVGEVDGSVRDLQGSFATANVELLTLFQKAKKADTNRSVQIADRARIWEWLASKASGKDEALAATARKRAKEWDTLGERLFALGTRYEKDKVKLEELLALDDEVVTPDRKRAFVEEFDAVYLPRAREIAEFFVTCREGATASGSSRDSCVRNAIPRAEVLDDEVTQP